MSLSLYALIIDDQQVEPTTIHDLSIDTISHICTFLPLKDFSNVSKSCKQFSQINQISETAEFNDLYILWKKF